MPNLEEWTIRNSIKCSFSCLTNLTISKCPKLIGLPLIPSVRRLTISIRENVALVRYTMIHTSITSLILSGVPDVLPRGLLQNHKALKSLRINDSSIRTLSNELDNLSALESLDLENCNNLEEVPEGLKYLNSLDYIDIIGCDSLVSIPATILEASSLRSLYIDGCNKLESIFTGALLEINNCTKLPDNIQKLSGLRELTIWRCERLSSLTDSIGALQSLTAMSISSCKELKSVPDCFKNLKSLKRLEITRCPEVEKRCKKPDGEDWHKISHIPNIKINLEWIQGSYY